jgi:cyclopropane fatty-acyl-phospholipid synthase-like methyltransferase
MGALSKRDGIFRNTPGTARFLAAGSPDYAGAGFLHTVNMWRTWSTLTDCVRKGGPVVEPGVEGRDPKWTQSFIAAMHRNAAGAARELAAAVGVEGVRRVLDIGGGSGAYSIALAQANPDLRSEVLDIEPVVAIARKHIADAGLSDRVTTRVGDLRSDEFGEGYDLILLSAICHMLSPAENQDLFARCFRAAVPGGRIVIRDFILEPDKTAPRQAAIFALNMLVATRGGSTYTFREYAGWLVSAGFRDVTRPDPAGDLIVALRG